MLHLVLYHDLSPLVSAIISNVLRFQPYLVPAYITRFSRSASVWLQTSCISSCPDRKWGRCFTRLRSALGKLNREVDSCPFPTPTLQPPGLDGACRQERRLLYSRHTSTFPLQPCKSRYQSPTVVRPCLTLETARPYYIFDVGHDKDPCMRTVGFSSRILLNQIPLQNGNFRAVPGVSSNDPAAPAVSGMPVKAKPSRLEDAPTSFRPSTQHSPMQLRVSSRTCIDRCRAPKLTGEESASQTGTVRGRPSPLAGGNAGHEAELTTKGMRDASCALVDADIEKLNLTEEGSIASIRASRSIV
ncbi:hypothetical protein CC78DRAFT_586794 [Lojkania enalia]|uniref:Uncharacterized protein n=1 Tax=Lojkania enalia TaxID=147567 RepID=A0A9P4JY81_9PLEO|nr:hypothetical protein CC78DRAFT_586794 [Didymosphaeria enalia]